MLIDTLRHELAERIDHQIAALITAKPGIEAAEHLAGKLRESGIEAHAVGQLCTSNCSIAVISRADPQVVEETLILLGVEFSVIDSALIENYTLRALQVSLSGQQVMVTIHHPMNSNAMAGGTAV